MEKILISQKLNKDKVININMKEGKIAEFVGIMLGDGNLGIYKTKAGDKTKIQHRISGKKELEKWFDIVGSSNYLHIKRAQRFLKEKVL